MEEIKIKSYILRDLEKWMKQNKAEYTGMFFEGCLLDNFMLSTKRGYAAIYEKYVNANCSEYLMKFAAYKNMKAVDLLFSEFITREEAAAKC